MKHDPTTTIEQQQASDIIAAARELALLEQVRALFDSKGPFGEGAEFRLAFVHGAMHGYCLACGSSVEESPCYCTRDD